MATGLESHRQVTLPHPTLGDLEVDELLGPLLTEFWAQGFATFFSCQGEPVLRKRVPQEAMTYVLAGRNAKSDAFTAHLLAHWPGRTYQSSWQAPLWRQYLLDKGREQRARLVVETDDAEFGPRVCWRLPQPYLPIFLELLQSFPDS